MRGCKREKAWAVGHRKTHKTRQRDRGRGLAGGGDQNAPQGTPNMVTGGGEYVGTLASDGRKARGGLNGPKSHERT